MAAAELVRGQNHPLPGTRITVRLSSAHPAATAVLLTDESGRLADGEGRLVHAGSPELPGVRLAADGEVAVDLGALAADVHRLQLALLLPTGRTFRDLPAPVAAVAGPDGGIASFTLTGLADESALVAVELYRRAGGWKVRAVGQGYAGGATALLADHGCPDPSALAAALTPEVSAELPTSRRSADGGQRADGGSDGAGVVAPTGAAGSPINTVHPRRGPSGPAATTPAPEVPPSAARGPVDTTHPGRPSPPPPAAGPSGPVFAPPVPPSPSSPTSATSPTSPTSAPSSVPPPIAGDAAGATMDERLYNQVWGIFEDAARSAAAYRSAVEYADHRQDQEIEALLADPRMRFGPDAELGRLQARTRRDELEGRARAVLDRDAEQLREELQVVERAMPAAMAAWGSAAWTAWQPVAERPFALRLGDLHLPENPDIRVPMLTRFPLHRGLWVDTGSGPESAGPGSAPLGSADRKAFGTGVATAVAARLLACHPPGGLLLHAVAPGAGGPGGSGDAWAPFARAGLLAGPPATSRAEVAALLESLVERVDLVQMARRAGAPDTLPPHVDPADRLLLVHDFPYGFDDRTVARLRYLADEGPAVGVHLLLVADRAESREYGPLLDPFWRGLTRLAPVEQAYLADPWVEHLWTFSPAVPRPGDPALPALLEAIARHRR